MVVGGCAGETLRLNNDSSIARDTFAQGNLSTVFLGSAFVDPRVVHLIDLELHPLLVAA